MSNKSKRFSVQGIFAKGASSHTEPVGKKSRERETSRSIKNKDGKRLTVYIPDEPVDIYSPRKSSNIQRSANSEASSLTNKVTSPVKATSKGPLLSSHMNDSNKAINAQFTENSTIDHQNAQNSPDSSSSTYCPDVSRNTTVSSSIYSALPSSGESHRNDFMSKLPIHSTDNEFLRRSVTTRNPTLLRKRRPPPKSFFNSKESCQENAIEESDNTVVVPGIKKDLPAINTTNELEIPSNEPLSSIESQCSPLHFLQKKTSDCESGLDFTEPLSSLPVIDISNQLVQSISPSSSLDLQNEVQPLDNNDSSLYAKSLNDVIDIKQEELAAEHLEEVGIKSTSSENLIPQIKMHIPSLRETISRDRSPEFEISKSFNPQRNIKSSPVHKHSRTISSIEDITNAIDSFQLTHSVVSEEHEREIIDNESHSSFKNNLSSTPSFEVSETNLLPDELHDLENSGLYLKVGDLPELEEGQTLENYIKNLEREIAEKKITVSSPLQTPAPAQHPAETTGATSVSQNLKPPKLISDKESNNVSENSSITDVFYEANESPKPISSKKMAFDELVSDESSVQTDMNDIQQSPPPPYTTMSADSVDNSSNTGKDIENDNLSVNWKEFKEYDNEIMNHNSTMERRLDLEDEIENTVHEDIPEFESYEDLYPDEISDESMEDESIEENSTNGEAGFDNDENHYSQDSDDDGMLEFTPKSPMSDQFLSLDQNSSKGNWIIKTPESYRTSIDADELEESSNHSSRSPNKTHLIVINGSPSSANESNDKLYSDEAQSEVPPLLPAIPSQNSLNREQSYTTITSNNQFDNLQYTSDFPIYDRREEPSVSPIQYSAVVTPVAPLLKKPLGNVKRPPPDFPTGGRRSRGLSTTNNNPEFFSETQNEVIAAADNERPGRGQRSAYVEKLRADAKVVNADKLPSSMLPIPLRIANKLNKKKLSSGSRSNSASTSMLLFSESRPRPRMLASEMDDSELPNATQLHSGKTKIPIHPDAEVLAASEEFKKIAALSSTKSTKSTSTNTNTSTSNIRRKDSIVSVAPNIQRMKLYIVNPDSD